jgi:hypothetical protein
MEWEIGEMLKIKAPKGSCACDLCGDNSHKKIRRTEDYLYLCSDCCNHKDIMAQGIVTESAVRFMMGNVM